MCICKFHDVFLGNFGNLATLHKTYLRIDCLTDDRRDRICVSTKTMNLGLSAHIPDLNEMKGWIVERMCKKLDVL